MRSFRLLRGAGFGSIIASLLLAGAASGQSGAPGSPGADPLWQDATAELTGATAGWTNKVEVADIDGDGLLDILHANGGDYDTPGVPERQGVYLNRGPGKPFRDASDDVFGEERFLARVIKARDVTGDGVVDLLVGTTYQTQTRLFRGAGGGTFEDLTGLLLPEAALSVGDLEVGDVDGDFDTDIVLADWGPGSPMGSQGAPVRLWRNTGEGWVDDPDAVPAARIQFSWDLELVDVDGDWDLDVAVSCKVCATSRLYRNDGTGTFSDVTDDALPAFANNYEFEAMDLDGDGDPELVTVNDGPAGEFGLTEHVFRNDDGVFVDATADWWPEAQNPGYDDNVIAFLDAESDGDADFLVGSLDGPDRLMVNDGTGHLTQVAAVFDGPATPGTLGIALGDLNGDNRLDVVEGEGEVAPDDHVFLATGAMLPDTAEPVIEAWTIIEREPGLFEVLARVHDRKTAVLPDDFREVTVEVGTANPKQFPLVPYGGSLWRAAFEFDGPAPAAEEVTVCATDRAGNVACGVAAE
jgi:hypothetical protein